MNNVIFSQKLYDTAQMIVDGCMGDADPACQTACPMHTDVKQYVRMAGEGDFQGALDLIRSKLFLPQTLGRICAHLVKRLVVVTQSSVSRSALLASNVSSQRKWITKITGILTLRP